MKVKYVNASYRYLTLTHTKSLTEIMKKEELRFGCLVMDDTTERVGRVVSIGSAHITVKYEKSTNRLTYKKGIEPPVRPISLTEEWLLKFGFEKIPHFTISNSLVKSIGRNRQLSIGCVGNPNEMLFLQEIDVDGKTINDLICLHNWDYDKELHVHQLQNLYYALTREELTIKP